ncbi:MAG: sugar transferase [Bacteroidota bacterium]|nr:sugar transferase [Bacteroidota bacterium]MDP4234464.1 sugar transferase [Bacteroidota bacterium]MDP4243954.1 sugar transferase [Bacteroidota bacterium]MDP4288196.1 sugar transferase [Bacteroidota bacterium]
MPEEQSSEDPLAPIRLVRTDRMSDSIYIRAGKRSFDLLLSILLVLLLLPFLLLFTFAIAITSRGPVILCQQRIGLCGKPFGFLKFRSMRLTMKMMDIDQHAAGLARHGMLLKPDNDPRVTRVGRFLRKHSLDELPQLINIIKGEMSFVGPRPLLPFMVEPYPEENRARSTVLPGLTGFWQIYARSESNSLLQMIDYDRQYIESISLRTDLRVLMATLPNILSGKGAK